MKKILLLATTIILICCSPKMKNESLEQVLLNEEVKLNSKEVTVDTLSIPDDLIYARYFYLYKDSILIVINNNHSDVYFLEFYNLNSKQFIAKMFRFGNGPEELLSANVSMNKNELILNDYKKQQVAFLNIDSVLFNPRYKVFPIKHGAESPVAVPYLNNTILIENPNCFKDDELEIDNKAPRFIVTGEGKIYEEREKYKYYTRNVACDGHIITDYLKDRVIYASMNNPEIEVYNNQLELQKIIKGPDQLEIKYVIEDGEVIYSKRIPYAYMNYCCDDNDIYFTYIGDFWKPKDRKLETYPNWILHFDWDGNLINSFFAGSRVLSISISYMFDNSLYVTKYDEEKNPILLKLTWI